MEASFKLKQGGLGGAASLHPAFLSQFLNKTQTL